MIRGHAYGVLGVGYEGRDIDGFVADLVDYGVTRVVDVRLTPISRKRGFSKTALRDTLHNASIRYVHLKALGNPKENRPGFGGAEHELRDAKARYARLLDTPDAQAALDEVSSYAENERIAVLCFEADQHRCHRDVVLDEIFRRTRVSALV
jgi:uncharacterized protein (DUF488 family)